MNFLEWIMAGMPAGNQTPASAQPSQLGAFTPPVQAPPSVASPSIGGSTPNFAQPDSMVPRPNPLGPDPALTGPITRGPLMPSTGDIAMGVNIDPKTNDIRRDPTTGQPVIPSMIGLPDPVIPQSNLPATAPLPPPRPQAPAAYATGKVPFSKPTPTPPPPAAGGQAGPNYEYYQFENDNGNLVWGTRPKGFQGAMGGTNPAGHAAQGFETQGMNLQQADAFNRVRPAGQPTGAAGSGVKNFFQSMKAPPGTTGGVTLPPGVQANYAGLNGNTPYGPMVPEGAGLTVPADYNASGTPTFGPGVPTGIGQQSPQVPTALPGDPQAGLPAWMKGSQVGNFLQLLGMSGGF